ncbi:MAG: hypothetical protein FJY67_10220, partial [Calditrichaeota bacterium]|nr:hypothetical protein [Calditrichota bacterium]
MSGQIKRLLPLVMLLLGTASADAVPQTDVVGYWRLDLRPGYNLVAFPVLPNTPTPQEVFGDLLGAAEITAWDSRLGRHRVARYNPQSERWEGDLFLLARGIAYWVNLTGVRREGVRLLVTGNPELYTRFRWSSLGMGWKFYAPTFGRLQDLSDLPPEGGVDILLGWNTDSHRFEMATARPGGWQSASFDRLEPDRAYLAHLTRQAPREAGPPTLLESLQDRQVDPEPRRDPGVAPDYLLPPRPLVVGNLHGQPLRNPDGNHLEGGFAVHVVRETVRPGNEGEVELIPEYLDRFTIGDGNAPNGRFRIPLTMNNEPNGLAIGDRIYLLVRARGGETQSNTFEIVESGNRLSLDQIPDLDFAEPLSQPGHPPLPPDRFALGSIHPNPFNERFAFDLSLPEQRA